MLSVYDRDELTEWSVAMERFTIFTAHTAIEGASAILDQTHGALGFVPNLLGVLAASAPALKAFTALNHCFAESSLGVTEREVVQLSVSTENTCGYCVAGHTAFAAMRGVDENVVRAVRTGAQIADRRLEALRHFTQALVRQRGVVNESELDRVFDAGYSQRQLLEVILGVCVKTFRISPAT